ncbi:major capsid protein [Lentilactobacillus senioris]|uniref:major capsid protein n=1 Tax=Lentilactobacillus senioris TaxID=931534 RepID=UPI003D2B7A45
MANSIFDDISSSALATYWTEKTKEQDPYLWETLFPTIKQESREFSWYRGKSAAPKALVASAYDAAAIMRERDGADKVTDETRRFKEGMYIDENLQKELSKVSMYGSQLQKDLINERIMADNSRLLKGAILSQEIIRNQIVQTGKVDIVSNGQHITADMEMKDSHIATTEKAWGTDGSDPFGDIQKAKDVVENDSGQTIARAVLTTATLNSLLKDPNVKSSMLLNLGNLSQVSIPKSELLAYMLSNYGLEMVPYDKVYNNGTKLEKFIPDGRVIFLPNGDLGNTYMSSTPEEDLLMSSADSDVSIINQGIAISTILTNDPVSKKTIVSQDVMPSFEQIDAVYNLNVAPAGSDTPPEGNGDGTEAPEA